ncbi:hypothetical protein M408DRAFT_5593 [Serendipita vermifera MAFF 305830]|uniref:histidine kinase n=1 Tax=Serendipita vermifera MAFF 305830 TaxID=933852 RepID=A0A0C2X8C8_SERVB|nr:hypothetical protein M408DRAFT_5593 [Serendipita vermifera MAFF 305830]
MTSVLEIISDKPKTKSLKGGRKGSYVRDLDYVQENQKLIPDAKMRLPLRLASLLVVDHHVRKTGKETHWKQRRRSPSHRYSSLVSTFTHFRLMSKPILGPLTPTVTPPSQGLPQPAVSSRSVGFQKSRWKAFKTAISIGTGYASKPPEWSGSTLDFSDSSGNNDALGDEEDAVLDSDDLAWISGKDGGDNLALILVERSHSATSQASPNHTSSHEKLPNYHVEPGPKTNVSDIADLYRLKGYEESLDGTHSRITWLWYRTVPWLRRSFRRYCYPEFNDPQVEAVYADRLYESQKFLAFVCSAYLVLSWIIAITLLPENPYVSDIVFFYGIAPAFTVPLPVMIFFNIPKRFHHFYQVYLLLSIWCWSAYLIAFFHLCDYYAGVDSLFTCGGRDMLNLFYYMIALPVIALFGMGQDRIYATISPLAMVITPTVLFYPKKAAWARFALEHLFLQALVLYIHWRREILERNVYYVNKKVKDTLIALHQTRLHQSRIEAARARSTSYIFHEVRQPLSAAFLAYQNLAASTSIRQDQKFEWDTLRIKLMSMSKLLNDVLDHANPLITKRKRMDAGKFEIVSRPFAFHSIIRQTIFGSQMAADMKNQELIMDLDKNIDRVARIGMYHAQQKSSEEIQKLLATSPDVDGVLTGDETRLSQVLNNLISNSSKFTPAQGKIRINTHLISPRSPRTSTSSSSAVSPRMPPRTSSHQLLTPPANRSAGPSLSGYHPPPAEGSVDGSATGRWEDDPDRVVVRIEVIDTGCGISPSDVKERRLFSPYAQAGVGRFQGGSGSGLGLSLVRRIVKLMGGRMGVESVPAAGTTFWVELPLRIAHGQISSPMEAMLVAPSILSLPIGSETVTPGSGKTTNPASPTILTTPPLVSSPMGSYTSAHPGGRSTASQSDATGSVPSATGMGLSVLVVDDDPIIRGLLQRLLRRLGCEVEGAENGQVALRRLGISDSTEGDVVSPASSTGVDEYIPLKSPPLSSEPGSTGSRFTYDVVFLDNQMPKMTGPEVAAMLRKQGRNDYLVGLSGDSATVDQQRFRQAGVDEFLSKPVIESQVKKVLQIARDRRNSKDPPATYDPQPP